MRILLVEDTEELAILFKTVLNAENHAVDVAEDGQIGWELIEHQTYDLVILDVMLPKLDGISICQQIRARGNKTPVLMLSGRATHDDKVTALDAGADDYLVKPPNLKEFTARVRALLRRGHTSTAPTLEWGQLRLDPNQREVSYGIYPLHFTPKEYAILELFLRNPQRVYSRSLLLDQLWAFDDEPPGEDTIRAHIKGLRQKLKTVGAEDLIETVYGVGYRLHPDHGQQATSVPQDDAGLMPTIATTGHQPNMLAQIWEQSQVRIVERISHLEQVLNTSDRLDSPTRGLICQEAHKLVGSLGAFGLDDGCLIARELETLAQSGSYDTTTERCKQLVEQLLQIVNSATHRIAITQDRYSHPPLPFPELQEAGRHRLLIVDDDQELTDLLVAEAATRDIQVSIAATTQAAHNILRQMPIDLILLDLALGQSPEAGLAFMTYLTREFPHLPIVVFTASNTLNQRLAVVQLNAKGFLQKPRLPSQVLDEIIPLLHQNQSLDAKVLALDDDPAILSVLQGDLSQWGIKVIGVCEPQNFWKILEETKPDLLLLDVQMHDINGIQICQTIRNDLKWSWLPVIFLTSCTDAETIHQIFAAGADDFCQKPIVTPELINRILNRLDRHRLLRGQSERDSLTNLSNRKRGTEEFNHLLQLASTTQQSVALGVLKLDHLYHINQHYGYEMGDRLLYQLGKVLKQELRKEDIIARWGGAEFLIGMYGRTREEGVEALATVLETLHERTPRMTDLASQRISFTAGVAQFPTDGKTLKVLHQNAKSGLEQARQMGGDRVYPATWQRPRSRPIPTVDVAIIHSDPSIAQQFVDMLERRGYSSQIVFNKATALEQLSGKKPKLCANKILLAVSLSDGDGVILLKQLEQRKALGDTQAVFLLHQVEELSRISEAGYSNYIMDSWSIPVIMQYLHANQSIVSH